MSNALEIIYSHPGYTCLFLFMLAMVVGAFRGGK